MRKLALALIIISALPAQDTKTQEMKQADYDRVAKLARSVQKEVLRLTEYGVFDDIGFGIKGSAVILRGFASRPILKSAAERVVKKIEGVSDVVNEIEVLPLSPNDDQLRLRTYVAIYGNTVLQRYNPNRGAPIFNSLALRVGGITNDPPIGFHPIHIIVKNGNVTLSGVVDNESDRAVAEITANGVAGVFSVKNELAVPVKKPKK